VSVVRTVARLEVATGGDPVGALIGALRTVLGGKPPRAYLVDVHHDDGCPAMTTGPMLACTCEVVLLDVHSDEDDRT
jgi:hypothetical protein